MLTHKRVRLHETRVNFDLDIFCLECAFTAHPLTVELWIVCTFCVRCPQNLQLLGHANQRIDARVHFLMKTGHGWDYGYGLHKWQVVSKTRRRVLWGEWIDDIHVLSIIHRKLTCGNRSVRDTGEGIAPSLKCTSIHVPQIYIYI